MTRSDAGRWSRGLATTLACAVLLGMGPPLWAVAKTTPKGVALTTPQGQPLAQATVTINFNSETRTAQTDDDGTLAIVILGEGESATQVEEDEDFIGIVLRGDGEGTLVYLGAPEGGDSFEVRGGILTLTGVAALVDPSQSSASSLSSTVTDVVVAVREGLQKQPTLGVAIPSHGTLAGVDRVSIEVGKKAASGARATAVPSGWTMKQDGKKLNFTGASQAAAVAVQVDLGGQKAPEKTKLELYSQGKRVYKETSRPQALTAVSTRAPEAALQLPEAVSAGQEVVFQAFESAGLPPWGVWSISGLVPTRIPNAVPLSYRFTVPHDWVSGLALTVSYRDVWGVELVQGTLETTVIAPPQGTPSKPTITDATTRILVGGSLCVCGWFPTAESRAGIVMNGSPLGDPASSSPEALIFFLHTETPPGPCDLVGSPEAGFGASDRAQTTLVGVGGSIDKDKLWRGESTPLRLEVYGTQDPITLKLRNNSPGVITIEGGIEQDVTTSGGVNNALVRSVNGHTAGDFNIVYELEGSSCPCAEGSFPRAD